jgi:hypothetical protein
MKSKSAEATAAALRSYMSFMGVPKILITDNDPTFRSEVSTLLASFHIQHQTSYPYMQRGNTVEGQVRKFLNAARAAISDSPIAKHTEWHTLYLLIIRVVDPDPDPYWIRIQLEAWIRIRIRNLNTDPDPDPGGQK